MECFSEPADEDREPECKCRFSGDTFDPRGCELHDPSSGWNLQRMELKKENVCG